MDKLLSVLIPTRNRGKDLHNALCRMRDGGLDALPYIIYDDASDKFDETRDATRVLPNVTLLAGKERIGQAGGRNILLRECKSPYALFMDDDTWFTSAETLPGILASDLTYEGIGRASAVCSQVCRTYDGETLFPRDLSTCRILNPVGMGCIVRVADILNIGAFRPYWRYRHEETELGLRMWKHDLPVVYDASLVVEHCHTTAARSSYEYVRNSARNIILMHALNLPEFSGKPLGILRALRLLLVGGYSRAAVLDGVREGIADVRRYRTDVNPMTRKQYAELCRFRKSLKAMQGK